MYSGVRDLDRNRTETRVRRMSDDLGTRLRAALEPLLAPDEQLRGVCAATQTGMFKGQLVAVGASDHRLFVQGVDRRFAPHGPPLVIGPGGLAGASLDGGGGGWLNLSMIVMDKVSVALRLKTTAGEKRKLMMMRGGSGVLGRLGGGEEQLRGLEALGQWLAANAPSG